MFRVNGRTPQTVNVQSKWTKMKVSSWYSISTVVESKINRLLNQRIFRKPDKSQAQDTEWLSQLEKGNCIYLDIGNN